LRPASKRLHPCRCAIDNTAFRVDHSPALVALDDESMEMLGITSRLRLR
jgi:hypothetical protein